MFAPPQEGTKKSTEGIIEMKCEDIDVSETLGIQRGEIECEMWGCRENVR